MVRTVWAGALAVCLACGGAGSGSDAVSDGGTVVRLAVEGMTCPSCEVTARVALERVPGVIAARVSSDSASAVVTYDAEETAPAQFIAALERTTGYVARVVDEAEVRR